MARITVEDCTEVVPNRYELVLLAANRARLLGQGRTASVPPERDKKTVIALREIAERAIPAGDMREMLLEALQRTVEVDEPQPTAAPVALTTAPSASGDGEGVMEAPTMSEEELLRAMQASVPRSSDDEGRR